VAAASEGGAGDACNPGEANQAYRAAGPEFHHRTQGQDFAEYDEVAANILMIVAGINPRTRRYTDPQIAMKQKIAQIAADKSLAATDKKELLNEFGKRLNAAQPIQYPSNIELVKKYYDQIHPIRRQKQG
jgi:hypothetical protein